MDIKKQTQDKITELEYKIGEIHDRMSETMFIAVLMSCQNKLDLYEEQLKDLNNYLNDLK